MKKNIISMLAAVAVVATVFTGCKKGEEDPGFTLSSRAARLAGEWTVSAASTTTNYTETPPSGSVTKVNSVSTYNGEVEYTNTTTTVGNNTPSESKDTSYYKEDYTFDKDGTWSSTKVETRTTYPNPIGAKVVTTITTTTNGTWDFNEGYGEWKAKEAIYLRETSRKRVVQSDNGTAAQTQETSGTDNFSVIWTLKRLAKDEIIADLASSYKSTQTSSPTEESTTTGTMTLTAK